MRFTNNIKRFQTASVSCKKAVPIYTNLVYDKRTTAYYTYVVHPQKKNRKIRN